MVSQTSLDTPQTRFCFRPCRGVKWFHNVFFTTIQQTFSNKSINHLLVVSVSHLTEPFAFSEIRGAAKISCSKLFEFGRPCSHQPVKQVNYTGRLVRVSCEFGFPLLAGVSQHRVEVACQKTAHTRHSQEHDRDATAWSFPPLWQSFLEGRSLDHHLWGALFPKPRRPSSLY